MEPIITIAIYIHAFFGGIGLITGIGSMAVKKGGKPHKRMGKIFTYSMLANCIISMPVSWMPGHKSQFLFLISIFTVYMVLSGNSALAFKSKSKAKVSMAEKALKYVMALFSLIMVFNGIKGFIVPFEDHILNLIFGGLGLFLVYKDLVFHKTFKENQKAWLLNHITHMMGAMIASVTAFIVAGLHSWTLAAWVLPSVIGTVYIVYWRRKINLS